MSIEGKCRFGKLQPFLQPNRDYLSKKPLFFRRKDDENFEEKNPFRQVHLNSKKSGKSESTRNKRKTFGSALAHNGDSTAVIQRLLKHSSPDLTNKVYTNVDPVLRNAVDQIPVGNWLECQLFESSPT